MDDEHLSLTWNNHGATYKQMLNLLRIENILTDCTLACDGYKFSVHRLVLVTCSNYFKTLLGDVTCQYPIVYLRGVDGKEMKALIEFMYLGKIDVPKKEVPNLLSTAETLQIKGLGVSDEGREGKAPCKRKRPADSFADEGRGPYARISSPLPNTIDLCENACADEDASSAKVSRREKLPLGHDERFPSISGSRMRYAKDFFHPPARDKSGDILGPVLKSSRVCSDNQPSISEGTLITPTFSASPKSNHSSHSETSNSLHSLPNLSLNTFSSNTGTNSDAKFNGASAVSCEQQLSTPGQDFETLAEVKEEAIDYTRSSSLQTLENSSQVSHFEGGASARSDSVHHNFQSDDASQLLDTVAKDSSTIPRPYRQDENTENARELGRPYLCPICCKSFAKIAILKRHHLAHFRPYTCHLCSRSFTRREVLAEHVLEHNGADLRLPCPVCKMTIKRKRNLQAHIKVKHPEYHMRKTANNEALC